MFWSCWNSSIFMLLFIDLLKSRFAELLSHHLQGRKTEEKCSHGRGRFRQARVCTGLCWDFCKKAVVDNQKESTCKRRKLGPRTQWGARGLFWVYFIRLLHFNLNFYPSVSDFLFFLLHQFDRRWWYTYLLWKTSCLRKSPIVCVLLSSRKRRSPTSPRVTCTSGTLSLQTLTSCTLWPNPASPQDHLGRFSCLALWTCFQIWCIF